MKVILLQDVKKEERKTILSMLLMDMDKTF